MLPIEVYACASIVYIISPMSNGVGLFVKVSLNFFNTSKIVYLGSFQPQPEALIIQLNGGGKWRCDVTHWGIPGFPSEGPRWDSPDVRPGPRECINCLYIAGR